MPLALSLPPAQAASLSENSIQWQPLTLDVTGPLASETDNAPNPFLDVRLTVAFNSPDNELFTVPGFFAGNGEGDGTGSVWRVRFTPDRPGEWTYTVSFVSGDEVAINDSAGTALGENGGNGSFTVSERDVDAPGFLAAGPIEYVGEHYLKQADGDFWIKGGVDSPENFFGYAGFDNTYDQPGGAGTSGLLDGVHRFAPHISDWREGDPLFVSADTGVDSKGIIGAINYLADEHINSLYFLPMNLGGDGRETYPFINADGSHEANTHYDVSKLHQWNIVLSYMQRKGIAAHIVLGETEVGNTQWLDEGQLGPQRKLFYRELVARFGYLNALKWNLSEESRLGATRHKQFATFLRSLDWAAHPIAVHTGRDIVHNQYDELLGDSTFDVTSIQFSPANSNDYVETWRQLSADAGWKWVLEMDEIGPAGIGANGSNSDELRRNVLYPVYFSGGSLEWYFGYHALPLGGDMRTEDFRTRESLYRYTWAARKFMQENLPFWEMQPADNLLSGGVEGDQVFASDGEAYAVYLNDGQPGKQLAVAAGDYQMGWYNPRNGEFVGTPTAVAGPQIEIGGAPVEAHEDWVLLVKTSTDSTATDSDPGTEPATEQPGTDAENPFDVEEPVIGSASPDPGVDPTEVVQQPVGSGAAMWLLALSMGAAARRRLLLASRRADRQIDPTGRVAGLSRFGITATTTGGTCCDTTKH